MSLEADIQRALGKIEGMLESALKRLDGHAERLETIEARLRIVENHAAKWGAVFGVAGAVLVAVVVELIKRVMH